MLNKQENEQGKEPSHSGVILLGLLFVSLVALSIYAFSFDAVGTRISAQYQKQMTPIDHHLYLRRMLDQPQKMYAEGQQVYERYCISCHGADGNLALAQARRLGTEPMRNTVYGDGADPVAMFTSLTQGFRLMPPQTHVSIDERYAVIHYIREAIVQKQNPSQYIDITEEMIAVHSPHPIAPLPTSATIHDKDLGNDE